MEKMLNKKKIVVVVEFYLKLPTNHKAFSFENSVDSHKHSCFQVEKKWGH